MNEPLKFTSGFIKLFPNEFTSPRNITIRSDITDQKLILNISKHHSVLMDKTSVLCTIQNTGNHEVLFFAGKGGHAVIVSGEDYRFIMLPSSKLIGNNIHIAFPDADFVFLEQNNIHVPETDYIQTYTDQAMVLGAGLATRFEPVSGDLTNIPKPSVPLLNGLTVIEHITRNLHRHGIQNLFVNTYYKPETIKKALRNHPEVNTIYIDEESPSGTAGGLIKALELELIDKTKPIIIVQGDAVSNINLTLFMDKHYQNNAAVSIAAKRVSDKDVNNFGIIASDHSGDLGDSGHITFFFEKPTLEESQGHRLASTGFYILAPEVYATFIDTYIAKGGGLYDYAKDFFPQVFNLVQNEKLSNTQGKMTMWVHEISEYWSDIGNPMQYIATVKDIYNGKVGEEYLNRQAGQVPPIFWHHDCPFPPDLILEGNIISVGV